MNFIPFEYTYSLLPPEFYDVLGESSFQTVTLKYWNQDLADELGLDRSSMSDSELAAQLSGQVRPPQSTPVAMAYSGHQFGHFNPNLGDGRAMLLGEFRNRHSQLIDFHLKGSGKTKYSRRGDGLANTAAVVREYLIGEGLYGLGIPCSRALALIETDKIVQRETSQPSMILVRTAKSHIRVGSFEHFVSRQQPELARKLADYCIERLFPKIYEKTQFKPEQHLALFDEICRNQADLVAKWLSVGFVHGVMNTDNTFISGETLDFGPCAFLEEFNSNAVFSSIDENGRYAYSKQPEILDWNLSVLAGCFLNFVELDQVNVRNRLEKALMQLHEQVQNLTRKHFGEKIGFDSRDESHFKMAQDFLALLQKYKLDMTLGFRSLATIAIQDSASSFYFLSGEKDTSLEEIKKFWIEQEVQIWRGQWLNRHKENNNLSQDELILKLKSKNPIFIPRNHQVERAIQQIVQHQNWDYFNEMLRALKNPYSDPTTENLKWIWPAKSYEKVKATFCNT